jgi:hypothetical protein
MEDGGLRARLGKAARTTIDNGFSLHEALTKLSNIYQRFGLKKRGESD